MKKTNTNIPEVHEIASQYCILLENCGNFPKDKFLNKVRVILAELYYRISTTNVDPDIQANLPAGCVSEEDWNKLNSLLQAKIGQNDAYQEVFDEAFYEQNGPVTRSLSEDLCDIYQDIKNFTYYYTIGNEIIMQVALAEFKINFEQYWGQKLTNCLRALHQLCFSETDISEEANIYEDNNTTSEEDLDNVDTSDWIISKRMNDQATDDLLL